MKRLKIIIGIIVVIIVILIISIVLIQQREKNEQANAVTPGVELEDITI